MKVLITGANGQLGWELQRTIPAGIDCVALQRADLDISNLEQVSQVIERERPDWVINAAAYTAVDKAEQDSELAYAINRDGPANIATACSRIGARLLQVSTDFVFDGKQGSPYQTTSKPNPLSVYGASKQAGDDAALRVLADRCTIVRTSWVYSAHGNNFVKTMLRLMSEREELGIVADQIGSPTWANTLARAIWKMVGNGVTGIQHWSDSGVASWYDFAQAIMEEGGALGLLSHPIELKPIRTSDYPTPALRPAYTVLEKSSTCEQISMIPQHWRVSLLKMIAELKHAEDTAI